jgi:integrase
VSRARTGTLIPPDKDGLWKARVTKTHEDGSVSRPMYSLGTTDKAIARRKLAQLVAALAKARGGSPADSAPVVTEAVREYAEEWLEKRKAQGVVAVADERRNLELHILPSIGHLPLGDVRSPHVRAVLEDLVTKPRQRPKRNGVPDQLATYSRQTIKHVRGVMHRLFDAAWRAEIIESNPVSRVRTPRVREVRKERIILTDAEFERFVGCAQVDLELRMASIVARCEGGMRTGDLLRWDWSMIDRAAFAECIVPRSKTGTPQALAIPPVLAPFLRAWWERAGCPASGAVFPARRGRNAGGFKHKNGYTFAGRLRTALFRSGVRRLPPIEVPNTSRGTRTDLGRVATGTKLAPNPSDPLYFETTATLPVDFHSFRRAFNTALAEAGVNVQTAMALAAHSDARTHMRYVMKTTAMRTIPEAVLPRLPATLPVESSRSLTIAGVPNFFPEEFQRATQESNLRPTAPERGAAHYQRFLARRNRAESFEVNHRPKSIRPSRLQDFASRLLPGCYRRRSGKRSAIHGKVSPDGC